MLKIQANRYNHMTLMLYISTKTSSTRSYNYIENSNNAVPECPGVSCLPVNDGRYVYYWGDAGSRVGRERGMSTVKV